MRFALLASLLLALTSAPGQDAPAPTPAPRLVRLHFVPPPLDGTISLGIYDPNGKLVRVLHREDSMGDFTVGHDALETSWDGNDDAGHPLPSGKYRARGYLVGAIKVEGVAYFFNDWVTDESSPHFARISHLDARENALLLKATTADGKTSAFLYDLATETFSSADAADSSSPPPRPAVLIDPIDLASGKDDTVWAVDRLEKGGAAVEIVQLSPEPAILRKLSIDAKNPQPIAIAAAHDKDRIFLLEDSPAVERVRSLTLQSTTASAGPDQTTSDWKVDFSKEIVAHQNFTLVGGRPEVAPNESPNESAKVAQKLRPNPLERDQPGKVELAVGFDKDGSYLKTTDGLPLRTISETPDLSRALLARQAENAVDVFEDDGAVVEQFRASNLQEMMAFDCGSFELK